MATENTTADPDWGSAVHTITEQTNDSTADQGGEPLVAVLARRALGWPKYARGEPATYGPLAEALTIEFLDWDAHLVAYSTPELPRRLGINAAREGSKIAIWDVITGGIPMVLHVVDADAKLAGRAMTDAWWSAERRKVASVFADMPGYAYTTRGGYRLVWRIDPFVIKTPLDHERWKALYLARLDHLRDRYGIVGDRACKDFPRHYRLPRVLRDGERTALTLREVGNPQAIGRWTAEVVVPTVRVPLLLDVDVPEPTWNAGSVDMKAAKQALAALARRKRAARNDTRAQRAADIIERVLADRPLVDADHLGVAGIGRDNTVFEAANLIAWTCPEIGPSATVEMLRQSVGAMDCNSGGGKGRTGYLEKASEVYVASVKKLYQAREQRRQADKEMFARLAASVGRLP